MTVRMIPHLEKAKELLAKGDDASLAYACLEARYAIELLCYERLRLRLKNAAPEDFKRWQPKHIIDALVEIVDPDVVRDTTLSVRSEGDAGDAAAWATLGHQKGLKPQWVRKEWNKVGQNLHVPMPRSNQEAIRAYPAPGKVREHLPKLIDELEEFAHSADFNFGTRISFDCECGQRNPRSETGLKDGAIVRCINPECQLQYVVRAEGDTFRFSPHRLTAECKKCGHGNVFSAASLNEMPPEESKVFHCEECGAQHKITWKLICQALENNDSGVRS